MLFCTCPEDSQSYQSWAAWYHLTQTPCRIFSVHALLLWSPKGTFGKVWWHKTQHQTLLSLETTARSGKSQCSTFGYGLVRSVLSWKKHALLFGLYLNRIFLHHQTWERGFSLFFCPSPFASYSSSSPTLWDLNSLTVYTLLCRLSSAPSSIYQIFSSPFNLAPGHNLHMHRLQLVWSISEVIQHVNPE